MTIKIGESYPCVDGDGHIKIIADLSDHGFDTSYKYVGLFINDSSTTYDPTIALFTSKGVCLEHENWNFKLPITKFGIGEYDTKTSDLKGVVTTISPHKSSICPLIGYVIDNQKRMIATMWTFEGRNYKDRLWDLQDFK